MSSVTVYAEVDPYEVLDEMDVDDILEYIKDHIPENEEPEDILTDDEKDYICDMLRDTDLIGDRVGREIYEKLMKR